VQDEELRYLMLSAKANKEYFCTNNLELCKKMTLPIFNELLPEAETRVLSLLEVTILASIATYAPTFEATKACSDIVLGLLESEYKDEKRYNVTRLMISHNIIPRLVEAKYPSADSIKTEGDIKEINRLFEKHLEICKIGFEKKTHPNYEAITKVREGIFFMNGKLIDQGLSWLKENAERAYYHTAVDELLLYYTHLENELTKSQIDIVIGHRIKQQLIAQGLSMEDAARDIGLTKSGLGQILTGRRGAKAIHLYNLSDLLDVEETYFFRGKKERPVIFKEEQLDAQTSDMLKKLAKATDEQKKKISIMIDLFLS